MNEEKGFNDVKELLTKNGIEFKEGVFVKTILAKVGRIIHWFHFSELSISVASSVLIGRDAIEISRISMGYEAIQEFCFIDGDLWIRGKEVFEYTIIAFNDGKGE